MKNLIIKLPVFLTSTVTSLLGILFLLFFTSAQYKSEVVFEVAAGNDESYTLGLLEGISGSSNNELYKVQQYLYTPDAIAEFFQRVPIESIYSNSSIKKFSKYSPGTRADFNKYFKKHIKLKIDPESETMSISAFAYNPEDPKLVALELISMVNHFIGERSRVDALIKRQYIICNLFFSKDQLPIIDEALIHQDRIVSNSAKSAKDILLIQAKTDSDECIKNIQISNNNDNLDIGLDSLFPKSVMNNLQANFSKSILESYYTNVANLLSQSSSIGIIAEPKEPIVKENRNLFLYSIIIFFTSSIVILGLKIIVNLTEEFEI